MEQDDLTFHPKASEEYIEALGWYTQCGEHLGQGFEQEIDRALRLIADSPERWPHYGPYHRRILVRRFPYVVVYFLQGAKVWIVAVAHGHRKPGYWRSRRVPI